MLTEDAARAQRDSSGGVDVAFVGDSIFESFRGTSYGRSCNNNRCKGTAAAFREALPSTLSSVVLAISGDQVQHVLWRVMTRVNESGISVPAGREFAVLRPKVRSSILFSA